MSFSVEVALRRQFSTEANIDLVFDSLADVPYSAGHFPKLKNLVDLGDECYRWEMDKIGLDRYYIQTVYTCEYAWDREEGSIRWTPVEDSENNALVEGEWHVKRAGKRTQLEFSTQAELTLPLPRIAKVLVGPLVSREFETLVDQYIENLQSTWSQSEV